MIDNKVNKLLDSVLLSDKYIKTLNKYFPDNIANVINEHTIEEIDPRDDCVVATLNTSDDGVWDLFRDKYFPLKGISFETYRDYLFDDRIFIYTEYYRCIYIKTIGYIKNDKDLPVRIAYGYQIINGYKIFVWNPTGNFRDVDMCENWVKERFKFNNIVHTDICDQRIFSAIKKIIDEGVQPKQPYTDYREYEFYYWFKTSFIRNGGMHNQMLYYCIGKENSKDPCIDYFLSKYNKMKTMVGEITHNKDIPFEKEIKCDKFTFKRTKWIGRHLIIINRDSDNFYITIGVKEDEETKNITEFYLVGTNSNYKDFKKAIQSTRHLW